MARLIEFVWDPNNDRWRKNGKWSKPPTRRELGKNKAGQLIDARGRRVPKRAPIAEPPKKPAKKKAAKKKAAKKAVKKAAKKVSKKKAAKKKVAKTPRKKRKRGKRGGRERPFRYPSEPDDDEYESVEALTLLDTLTESEREQLYVELQRRQAVKSRKELRALVSGKERPIHERMEYSEDGESITRRNLASSRKNNEFPDRAHEAFGMSMFRKMEAAGYSPDDVLIYRYGLQFITTGGGASLSDVQSLVRDLAREYPHVSFAFAGDRVSAFLGRENLPVMRGTATARMQHERSTFNEIWQRLHDLWDGDISWFAVAENDELVGKSD